VGINQDRRRIRARSARARMAPQFVPTLPQDNVSGVP
jgi:hypothetical protein